MLNWLVSMVTSLMGVRGYVQKRSPVHSPLYVGRKLYGVCRLVALDSIQISQNSPWLLAFFYFILGGKFFFHCNNK